MQVQTSRFGLLDVAEDKVFTVIGGLYGFEGREHFTLLNLGPQDSGLYWLQSLDDGDLAFILVNPLLCAPDYDLQPPDDDLAALGLADLGQALVMAICSVPEDFRQATANLQAPLLFNPEKRLGGQIITGNPVHALRHPIFPTAAAAAR